MLDNIIQNMFMVTKNWGGGGGINQMILKLHHLMNTPQIVPAHKHQFQKIIPNTLFVICFQGSVPHIYQNNGFWRCRIHFFLCSISCLAIRIIFTYCLSYDDSFFITIFLVGILKGGVKIVIFFHYTTNHSWRKDCLNDGCLL